jgi:hypothetical protein
MNIAGVNTDYKIVGFDETIGQIQIKYDVIPYTIPLDLHPDDEGNLLEGEQLDIWIRNACPIGYVLRENTFKSGIKNLDAIRSLVVKIEEPDDITTNNLRDIPPTSPEEIEEIINIIKNDSTVR